MNENEYVNPEVLINELESILNMSFMDIKDVIISSKVNLDDKQVKEFLDKKSEEDNPGLKSRINTERDNKSLSIDESIQAFMDYLDYQRYEYIPYTLFYYKKYINILRIKCLRLIDIVEHIFIKNCNSIRAIVADLDISIDEDGYILYSDVKRIEEALIHCFNDLLNKLNEANDLNTYLKNKISLDKIYRKGLSEKEVYPASELQPRTIYTERYSHYIRLTERQQKEMLDKDIDSFSNTIDFLFSEINEDENNVDFSRTRKVKI